MIGRRLISGRQALGVEFDMRSALYARMLRLSFGFYDRHQTGQLMSRATVDLQTVRFFLGYGLIFFFQNALTLVGAAAVMFVVNWKLTLVALWIAPLLIGLAYRYSHVSHPLLRDVQQKMADVATVAEENIVGVHVVKSFAQERAEQAKFERASESVFRQSVAANRQRAVYVPLLSFLPLLAQAAVLLVGGRMVIDGTLSLPVVLLVQHPRADARHAVADARHVDRPGAARDRVRRADLRDHRRARRGRGPAGAVELPPGPGPRRLPSDVRFEYVPGRAVLHGIDLELDAGIDDGADRTHGRRQDDARRAGRRASTTRRRAACALDGVDVRDVTLSSLRRAIGVVSQDPFLFSATVRENIAFGRRRRRRTRRSSARPSSRRRTSSSSGCPTATTR